jgi:hypothetical protein
MLAQILEAKGKAVFAPNHLLLIQVLRLLIICNGGTGNTSWSVSGISACGGFGDKFYYNSIQLSHPTSANVNNANGPFAGFSNGNPIQTVSTSNLEFKNNVVVLTGATAATSTSWLHYAHSSASYTGSNISNNRYFSNLTGNTTNNIGLYAGISQTTLSGWQTSLSGESGTTLGNPLFNANDNLVPAVGSPLAAAGTPISGITTDFRGDARSATTPSIGAYENARDAILPVISYTAISNQTSTGNITLSGFATITDASGINTNAGSRPRMYFKKSTDANSFAAANNNNGNGWKWVEASNTTSPFDFTIDVSLLQSAPVVNDIIQYFVVAQDIASIPNLAANPSVGFSGTGVATITAAPTTPNSYVVVDPPMSGTYNIGASQTSPNYTTITAALFALQTRGIAGPVTLNLMDANYNAASGETFPLTLGTVTGASAINTITLKPSSGITSTITAVNAGSAAFRFNGTDYFIIDGSNNGTNSRNLTIINNTNTLNSAVLWLASQGTGAGCSFFTIKNCNVSTSPTIATNAIFDIYLAGTSISTAGQGADNDNVIIENNQLSSAGYGIYAAGVPTTGELNNLEITRNIIGTNVIAFRGIDVSNITTNSKISGNEIMNIGAGVNWTGTIIIVGIQISGTSNNTEISNNKIYNTTASTSTSSTAVGAFGISTASNSLTNITIHNNLIYGVRAHGVGALASSTGGMAGIRLFGGTNNKVYHNTVVMNSTPVHATATGSSFSAAMIVNTAFTTALDVRNNIFINTAGMAFSGSKAYSLYYNFASTTGLTSNNNILFGNKYHICSRIF